MVVKDLDFEKLETLFHPINIAFVGASEKSPFGAMLYLSAFKTSKWKDTFYPVNPKYDKILDWKCYKTILDIPYPIDTAYISVKTKHIPQVLKECVEKDIPWVIIFSSGFSETGDPAGLTLEKELKQINQELIQNKDLCFHCGKRIHHISVRTFISGNKDIYIYLCFACRNVYYERFGL